MPYTTLMVFHKHHPNDFCRPPPLRTIMGHPPTTPHRYAPGAGSIGMHIFMPYTTLMVFHKHHPNDFCRPPPLRTIMGHPPTTPIGTRRALVQLGCKYSCHIPLLWSFTSTTQMIFAGHHHCAPSWVTRRQPPSVRAGRWFNWDANIHAIYHSYGLSQAPPK